MCCTFRRHLCCAGTDGLRLPANGRRIYLVRWEAALHAVVAALPACAHRQLCHGICEILGFDGDEVPSSGAKRRGGLQG